jgi:hypothetical protein
MKRRPVSTLLQRQVVPKKVELSAAIKQRDALWALLNEIDEAHRGHDDARVSACLARRFDVYSPSS